MVDIGYNPSTGEIEYDAEAGAICEGCCGPEIVCDFCGSTGTIRITFANVLLCSDSSPIGFVNGVHDVPFSTGGANGCVYRLVDVGNDVTFVYQTSTLAPASTLVDAFQTSTGKSYYTLRKLGSCILTGTTEPNDKGIGDCGGAIIGYDGTATWAEI